ncbi:MAG TPA: efflux RND transporter periplasmic adaptor subunit [Hyphomonadaceae bacterium]|nr:efflux RND transporter periplasmic adaptor subunit [Hyphomonadaceae bacterium]HPN06086.1 efflux RND transporter periplasmic adaptor subunit [Hyphomonadaceae bacterium]
MIRLPKLLLAAVALSSLAACGGPPQGAPDTEAAAAKPGANPKTVNTPYATIAAGKVDIEGGLVDVAARAPGVVKEVFVQEGDLVKAGQILAQQENDDARLSRNRVSAQLAQAEAQIPVLEVQLGAADREEKRLARLIAEDATSQQLYQQAQDNTRQLAAQLNAQKASIALVRAQLAEANYQMELYVIRAPTDGTIVRRYANPGSGASTFSVTAMFQLQPESKRIVRAEVEERSISLVKAGQKVEIVPESDQAKTYPGEVIRIAAVMGARKLRSDDPSERADERVVEVVVDAEQAPVLVGQRVLVKFLKEGATSTNAAATSLH